ncbi:MAG: hypothetical protein ACI9SE_004256, partial [Neolewinella sp.]
MLSPVGGEVVVYCPGTVLTVFDHGAEAGHDGVGEL